MLYDAATYNDSLVYKQKPVYITNTLEKNTTFKIENIKEGNYYLVALKDKTTIIISNPKQKKLLLKRKKLKFRQTVLIP